MQWNAWDFVGGYDMAKSRDHPAICILGRREEEGIMKCRLSFLRQLPRGVDYKDQVSYISHLSTLQQFAGRISWGSDYTGVGASTFERILEDKVLSDISWGISFTSGQKQRQEGVILYVPRKDLVSNALALFQDETVLVDWSQPHGKRFKKELLEFEMKINQRAATSYEARSGTHDDTVAAYVAAGWLANFLPLEPKTPSSTSSSRPFRLNEGMPSRGAYYVPAVGSRFPRPPR
jgi:hypothetical protein